MFKKRKAQGLSINTIILVVIGLIVLVIIIAILTGKIGLFSKGIENAASCENACKALGRDRYDKSTTINEVDCKKEGLVMPGDYSGVSKGSVCCCVKSDTASTQTCAKVGEDCGLLNLCCTPVGGKNYDCVSGKCKET